MKIRPYLMHVVSSGGWLALVLLLPVAAHANLGAPSWDGEVVGEPEGIKNVAITHETLRIDLRSLPGKGDAQVEAVYRLNNVGPSRTLYLLFFAGTRMDDLRLSIDGKDADAVSTRKAKIPASWQVPKTTPGIGFSGEISYSIYSEPKAVVFRVLLFAGVHAMRASYTAQVTKLRTFDPMIYRQFVYVLAPARSWAGFGGLDVTIHVPEGWDAACSLALNRQGDTLQGSFPDLPANTLALTVRKSPGWLHAFAVYGSLGLFGIALIGGAFFCHKVGWLTPGLPLAWAVAVLVTGLTAIYAPVWILSSAPEASNQYRYGLRMFGMIGIGCLTAPIGLLGLVLTISGAIVRLNRPANGESRESLPPNSEVLP